MPSKNLTCKIDQRSIDKYVKEQRMIEARLRAFKNDFLGLTILQKALLSDSTTMTFTFRNRHLEINCGQDHVYACVLSRAKI